MSGVGPFGECPVSVTHPSASCPSQHTATAAARSPRTQAQPPHETPQAPFRFSFLTPIHVPREMSTATCTNCGAAFARPKVGRPKRFCSTPCSSRHRYLTNQETLNAKSKAYYAANREARLAYALEANRAAYTRTRGAGSEIIAVFERLPEGSRKEYAEWIMFLAFNEGRKYRAALQQWDVDDWMGRYLE